MKIKFQIRSVVLGGLAAAVTLLAMSQDAAAQKNRDGTRAGPAPVDDGFRPVPPRPKAAQSAPRQEGLKPQAAQAYASAPSRIETTIYDRWTVTCQDNGSARKACSAALRIVNNQQQIVILWQIGVGDDGQIKAMMQTPTGVMIQNGVDLKIGDANVGRLQYSACVPQNCEASGAMDDHLIKAITAAKDMMVTIRAKDGRDVNFKFPLQGIDKAVAAVRS